MSRPVGKFADMLMEVPVVGWADRAGLESGHQQLAFRVGPIISLAAD